MTASGDAAADKIADEALQEILRSGEGSASVIVELAVPSPRVEWGEDPPPGAIGRRPMRIEAPSPEDQERLEEISKQGQRFLERVAEASPVPLTAGSFAIRVTGQELDAIARSPLVRRIHHSQLRG